MMYKNESKQQPIKNTERFLYMHHPLTHNPSSLLNLSFSTSDL